MALRISLVTPFAWSQPHDVNEHVAGARGTSLRIRGHDVTVLGPSNRARDLAAGRRALAVTALYLPTSSRSGRRSRSRAGAAWASRSACGPTSRSRWRAAASTSSTASSRACRASPTSRSARRTRSRPRPSSPPTASATRRAARSATGCSRRLDALLATARGDGAKRRRCASPATYRARPARRRPGRCSAPGAKQKPIVVEWRPARAAAAARDRARARRAHPGGSSSCSGRGRCAGRPTIPRALRGRVARPHRT